MTRTAIYAGEPASKTHLQAAGFAVETFRKEALTTDRVLIVGPGGAAQLADQAPAISRWLKSGGYLLALGLDDADARSLLLGSLKIKRQEHIATYFTPASRDSPFCGIGPADMHNRDPRTLPLVAEGAALIGNGVLAKCDDANVVFCQLLPWQFQPKMQMNLKRTFRSSSRQLTRLLANLGAASETPILGRFASPPDKTEQRWLSGLYLDVPEEWDYPYRFFRW